MSEIRPLIAGNWKMNGLTEALGEARQLAKLLADMPCNARVALCPPHTLVSRMAMTLDGSSVEVGGQDCHAQVKGAFTGDVSAEMLADAGARLVIVAHSERRAGYGETVQVAATKVRAALRAGLEPIVCVGETLEEREAGRTLKVVGGQVEGSLPEQLRGRPFAVAYEPVWAIGTGHTPTLEQIEEVHRAIRGLLAQRFGEDGRKVPILYGGSVNPKNAAEILKVPDVGGALVGGASLRCADFLEIVRDQVMNSLPKAVLTGDFAVAYEPVWAIGTGLTPTLEQIEEVHRAVRAAMLERLGLGSAAAPILYGGSVNPKNAAEILKVPEVGGALVGGASLKAADFLGIIRAA